MRTFLKVLKIAVLVVVASALFGWVVMQLWNWLVPGIFGWHTITFVQAIGLFVLCKLLFGGFHRHGGRGRGRWRQKMHERFEEMSPEEREHMRTAMRGCSWGRRAERPVEKEMV
jgi:uncharacterized membrane protein